MTIKEIAELAGVSISTVSKIINNKDKNIHPETRNRVLKIVKEYNYTPYSKVKYNTNTKTFILAILTNSRSMSNLFVNGVIKVAQENGYSVLLYDSKDDLNVELKNITSICKNVVDGVIWEPINLQSLDNIHLFEKQNINVNIINSPFYQYSHNIDFLTMGYNATKTLLDYGHTHISCLLKQNSMRSEMVFEGFKKCLFDHEIIYSDDMKLYIYTNELDESIATRKHTGIVSSHYASSLILLEMLSKYEYQLPYDLSLVSLRDDIREDIRFPQVSSFKIPYGEFGEYIGQKLIYECEKSKDVLESFKIDFKLENTASIDKPIISRKKRILIVGSINIDITLNVDALPQPGRTISTSRQSTTTGGKGANQAVGVSKLGFEASIIGKVGTDFYSTLVYSCMHEYNIDTSGIRRESNIETGKAYIHLRNDGESMITILNGANEYLQPEDIELNKKLFNNIGYCLLQSEVPIESIITAARLSHKCGGKNIIKPAAINTINKELMELIDIFIPNKTEANLLCPNYIGIEDKANYFVELGAKNVIITLGKGGCYIKSNEFTGYLNSVDFTVIDTTGAADAFISCLSVYLSQGYGIKKSAQIATYAAGFCVSRQGVISALIDKYSLEAYINTFEPSLLYKNH